MSGVVVHRFGPFALDAASQQLFRDEQRIRLPYAHSAVLVHLVSHAGVVVPKETLMEAGWGRAAITQNSLDQAISRLRKVLDASYIETLPNEGYRFIAAVQRAERDEADLPVEDQLAPFRAFLQGRADLYSLDRDGIQRARHAFEHVLREAPHYARAHVGLAMACGLAFEASTPDARPDAGTLQSAIRHARKGCALAHDSADAWITLAFVLYLNGETDAAGAAACKAMSLDPEDWRHALRAAYVSWGEERLWAARQVLTRCPGLGLAHWLRSTVFIARGAPDTALDELRLGCKAQDAQAHGAAFPAVGLHLLHALVLAARDELEDAEAELARELSSPESGQVYARECAANTWYALGAVYLRQHRQAEAEAAFARALTIAPRHVSAASALRGHVPASAGAPDMALAQAIVLARRHRHADAARIYRDAIAQAPPGSAGWMLAVEPVLNPPARGDIWTDVLALIRARAF